MSRWLFTTAIFSTMLLLNCGGGGGSTTNNVTPPTPVAQAPTITQAPVSIHANWGTQATFTVTANGTAPLNYQWRYDGKSIGDNQPTLNVTTTKSTLVDVTVSNSAGSVTSSPASLWMSDVTPTIISKTASCSVQKNAVVNLTVEGGGGDLNYIWLQNGTAVGTDSSYQYVAVAPATFNVRLTNLSGSITSDDIVISINEAPSITQQPISQTCYEGDTATFIVGASGSPAPNYKWKKNGVAVGTNSNTYITQVLAISDSGSSYSVDVSNSSGTISSSNALLTVKALAAPTITQQPQDQSVDIGDTATFNIIVSGGGNLTYQWFKNGVPVGSNSSSYSLTLTQSDIGAKIYVTATNKVGTVTSNIVNLNQKPTTLDFSIGEIRLNQAIQLDDNSVPIIAGRSLYIQVFPIVNQTTTKTPMIQIDVLNGTKVVQTQKKSFNCPTSLDLNNDNNCLSMHVAGSNVVNGYQYRVTIDPDGLIGESNKNNNVMIGNFTTVTVPIIPLNFVPLIVGGKACSITDFNQFGIWIQMLYPIPDNGLEITTASPYIVTSITNADPTDDEWGKIINEVEVKRQAENSNKHYIGVMKNDGTGTGYVTAGMAYMPGKSIIIRQDQKPYPHELGHNFGRPHVECNGINVGQDPSYPYSNGVVKGHGVYNYSPDGDIGYALPKGQDYDMIGYCYPRWISDYNYKNILNAIPKYDPPTSSETGSSLLIWGHWNSETDAWTLEPTFTLSATSNETSENYETGLTVQGLDKNGNVVLKKNFKLNNTSEAQINRSFVIRVNSDKELAELQVVENGKIVATQKAEAVIEEPVMAYNGVGSKNISYNNRAVMMMNEKGEVISIIRNATKAAILDTQEKHFILHVSNGVGSRKFERNF